VAASWTITGADSTLYTVLTDVTTTYSAVITGAVTDELFGAFNMPGFTVQLARTDLQTKATAEGLYAITGYPALSFPQLATTAYSVSYTLVAPGFRDFPMQVPIPVNSSFPVTPLLVAPMRRLPVRLQGRVVLDSNGAPVVGASVISVDNPNPPSPPPPPPIAHSMLLRSTLYAAHPLNAPVQAVTLTQTGNATLTQPAVAGATALALSSTTGLTGPAFVQIMSPDLTLIEYALVASLGPASGQVNLTTPLNRSYGTTSTINFVTAALAGSAAHLLADPNIGDGILVADALLAATTVVVDDGAAAVEYHEIGAITDSMGYYAFNGVGRVQELFLQANGVTPPTSWMIEFDQPTNIVDFRI
jgi:hypothetical protein